MRYDQDECFVLSSSCRAVKGANRSVLVDYLRKDAHIIPNDFYEILGILDRNKVNDVLEMIDEASQESFFGFVDFLLEHEFGFLTLEPERFPKVSEAIDYDEIVVLKDAIIEIDQATFEVSNFEKVIDQISDLNCNDLQIRFVSSAGGEFLREVLEIVNRSNVNFMELHLTYHKRLEQDFLFKLLDTITALSKIYLYDSPKNEIVGYSIEREDYLPLNMGNIYYIKTPLAEDHCGVITFESLTFDNGGAHNLHKSYNGCLYKKLTIDRHGNIKNCPAMTKIHGHASETRLEDVLKDEKFRTLWTVKKDDIAVCKDCEFRYNCTDCRAFLTDPEDIYSKPMKCGYNPYTNKWEEWSKSLLRRHEKNDALLNHG